MFYSSWFWVIVTGQFSLSFLWYCHWPVSLWPGVNFSVIVPFTILSVLSLQIYSTIRRLRDRLIHSQGSVWKVGSTFPIFLSDNFRANGGGQGRLFRRQETVQQSESKEHNLAVILIFTTATFLILHTPRFIIIIIIIQHIIIMFSADVLTACTRPSLSGPSLTVRPRLTDWSTANPGDMSLTPSGNCSW